jgi:hypothetical protein
MAWQLPLRPAHITARFELGPKIITAERLAAGVWGPQQEVNSWRPELQQRLVRADRRVTRVNSAQQPAEQMTERGGCQLLEPAHDRSVAALSVCAATVTIMCVRVTVQAHAHVYVELIEEFQISRIEKDGVGLKAESHIYARSERGSDRRHSMMN